MRDRKNGMILISDLRQSVGRLMSKLKLKKYLFIQAALLAG